MAIPLHKICELPCFDNIRLAAGVNSVLSKQVTGVTIVEAPDIAEWIKGGELLLTSLYNFHEDYDRQKEMVTKLAQKGAAGLIVKISRFVKDIPKVIIEAGNEYGLPIFELPGDVKYIDILYPVMCELFNRQVTILEHYKKCHSKFIDLSLNEGTLNDIIHELSQIIRHPVILLDHDYKIISSSSNQFSSGFDLYQKMHRLDSPSSLELFYHRIGFEKNGERFETDLIITPLMILDYIKVYLAIDTSQAPLSDLDYVAIETAVSNISLALVKQKAIQEIEYRFKNDIIDDLIQGRYHSESDLESRAKTVGWDLNKPYVVILVQLQHIGPGKDMLEEKNILRRKESVSRILMVINNTATHYVKNPIIISKSDRFIILFPSKNVQSSSIKRFSDELHSNIKSQIQHFSACIGIGTESTRISELKRSYSEATDAASFGKMVYGDEVVIEYDQLGVYRLLCQFKDPEELKRFIHPALMKLSKYDTDKNNDLIRTLEVYLSHNANAKKTAEELFIHYKTVQYRINRIKEIMGIEFESKIYKMEIEMGLKIINLLDQKISE